MGRPRKEVHTVIKEWKLQKELCPHHGCHMITRAVYTTGQLPTHDKFCRRCVREERQLEREAQDV
jgi:hypothetical protein